LTVGGGYAAELTGGKLVGDGDSTYMLRTTPRIDLGWWLYVGFRGMLITDHGGIAAHGTTKTADGEVSGKGDDTYSFPST
jgi:hypothetical protein